MDEIQPLLRLLQLASPALPVGAFSYSEGLETLVEQGNFHRPQLHHWLQQALEYGAVRVDGAVMVRSHRHSQAQNLAALAHWNQWLSAMRETAEIRQQSWQMGRAWVRTLQQLHPELQTTLEACGTPCNFAVAYGVTAAHWQISLEAALLGYLQSWATNLINAAVKLVPLGQTTGQQVLFNLYPALEHTATAILQLKDEDIATSSWGAGIASMQHETLYSRLFRS